MNNRDKKEKLITNFYEINERLTAGLYVCSGQTKRYLKTLIKVQKHLQKPSYGLVGHLHGMQGSEVQIDLAPLNLIFNIVHKY